MPAQVVAVHHALHVPVVGLEALVDILGKAQFGGTVERDEVVVVEDDQLAQAEGSGQRGGLVREALHHVAVAAQHVGVMVHDFKAGPVVDGAPGASPPWPCRRPWRGPDRAGRW